MIISTFYMSYSASQSLRALSTVCRGVKTASLLYEDHGNMFFTGVGIGAEKLLNETGFVVHDTHKHAPNYRNARQCSVF